MADALSILEQDLASKLSNESFHSSHSQQQQPPSPNSNNATTDLHALALKAAGLPIYDVDAYLNDPRNQAALDPLLADPPPPKKQKTMETYPPTPVQLGAPKTSHNVTAFYHLCQERGLDAVFDIDGAQAGGFGGTVVIGGQTIASEQRWRNKKDAKEGLAELALPVVREMEAARKGEEKAEQEKNWVGMLMEYHSATDPSSGPIYTEYALARQFACTCTIPSLPNTTFGSPSAPFPNKKAAKVHASKEAVRHLISTGDLNPDGTIAKPRRKPGGGGGGGGGGGRGGGPTTGAAAAVTVQAKGVEVKKDATYAARVADMAALLSLPAPAYSLHPTSPAAAPNLLSGACAFNAPELAQHPLLGKPLGEVRNVFGKKNAKEECARGVWEVLRQVARERGVEVEEV